MSRCCIGIVRISEGWWDENVAVQKKEGSGCDAVSGSGGGCGFGAAYCCEGSTEMRTRLLCVDVETGGLDAGKHALLSVAAVDSLDGDAFTALIQPAPGLLVDEQALEVNGFSMEFLEKAGRPEKEVMAELCLWLGARRSAVLAGCNVGFDKDFLMGACARAEVPWLMSHRTLDIRGVAWLAWEVGELDLAVTKAGQPRLDLDSIARACGYSRTKKTHDALEDALMTLACFERLTRCVEMAAKQSEPEVKVE